MDSGIRFTRGVVIHGGVGTISAAAITMEVAAAYRAALTESLLAGHEVIEAAGTAVEATVAAVQVMEDSELFNAGRGSNFDERGVITMDASIMDGSTLGAGAVAGVTDVRSPVHLSQLVMERSEHLMLIGEGAEAFARSHGVEVTDPSFFHTDRRWAEMERAKASGAAARPNVLGDDPAGAPTDKADSPTDKAGTVGAVALDAAGRLAAATSTGGMANKTWGRVGDSPVIGAGTYASELCAVSCTGWGEYFIKNAAAFDVHARMRHAGASLAQATHGVIFETLNVQVPGSGGMVALDREGRVELCYNTPGMYRGWIGEDGVPHVGIFREE
jgi:L-asparaginase / beta-aspartyl-peptidase